jgi:hypothetical protein
MTELNPKSAVRKEQFGKAENTKEQLSLENDRVDKPVKTKAAAKKQTAKVAGKSKKKSESDKAEKETKTTRKKKTTEAKTSVKTPAKKKKAKPKEEKPELIAVPDNVDKPLSSVASEKKASKTGIEKKQPRKRTPAKEKVLIEKDKTAIKKMKEGDQDSDLSIEELHDQSVQNEKYLPERIKYAELSKEELVSSLKELINNGSVSEIRKDIEIIKSCFYKQLRAENEEIKKKFIEEGGQLQDFKIEENPLELELRDLMLKYRDHRVEFNKHTDEEKVGNLKEKYDIIEAIKELVNSKESLNRTFQEFRELQSKWREIGPVPQQNLKDLWESYHYHVEAFYDYIKINKELRDLDLKKNLELKIKLCEKAEELLLEPSVVEAFRELQTLHDQWREIGPVQVEKRSEIWERFKEATSTINRKHQEYFVNLKQDQKKNYEEKLMLCEKAEEIAAFEIDNHKEWEARSRELVELQKIWKTIGFAPKKFNNLVYERFRKACDKFFEKKRGYFSQNREEQQNNLQFKTELCIQAEALQNSTDWKKTTDELIALQKKWKEVGPVSAKNSDKIWRRFRAACDKFFENKSKFFSHIDTTYEENLEKKNSLIAEIEKFELTTDVEQNLNVLKDFQRRWTEIGYVPLKQKNEIQEKYRKAINSKFDQLKLDENKKSSLKFRSRLENIIEKPNSQHRMQIERDKFFNKLKQLENDITLWENNIGFFTNSMNAESMIADVNNKIENAKKRIEELKAKIRILDELED